MPLDYKRSYKTKLIHRKIITISVIAVVFLLSSFFIIYLKFWDDSITWNPFREDGTEMTTADVRKSQGEKHGLALMRQPVYLYTIGIARISLSDVNQEYVLENNRVDDSYFDDALFIGDSRTEGFMMYSSLKNIHAYCSKGLSITRIYEEEVVTLEDGRTVTVMEALQTEKYGKIYIMFGVNELGWPYDDAFEEQYSKMLRDIKQLQPDALIYVQNIIPISAERSKTDGIYNNDNVYRFNDIIKRVCETQNVIYLDVASSVADETGALPADASTDGIHCNGTYCDIWLEYLRNNTYIIKTVHVGTPAGTEDIENTTSTEESKKSE